MSHLTTRDDSCKQDSKTDWPETAEFIAEQLRGTCDSLTFVLEFYEMEGAEDDFDFCVSLDSHVFCCEQCNWWFTQAEIAEGQEDWICEDCYGESQ